MPSQKSAEYPRGIAVQLEAAPKQCEISPKNHENRYMQQPLSQVATRPMREKVGQRDACHRD